MLQNFTQTEGKTVGNLLLVESQARIKMWLESWVGIASYGHQAGIMAGIKSKNHRSLIDFA